MRTTVEIAAMQRKLRKVFQRLRDEGILARMDYCQNSSIFDQPAPPDKSVVFYGQREIEFFKSTGLLALRYSTPDGDPASTRALGFQVQILLELAGLETQWDSDPDQAIIVMDCVES